MGSYVSDREVEGGGGGGRGGSNYVIAVFIQYILSQQQTHNKPPIHAIVNYD